MAEPRHLVQFYRSENTLEDTVAPFLASGLDARQKVLLVATGEHMRAWENKLSASGRNVAEHRSQGRWLTLDARETLDRFMRDGSPDPGLFLDTIGSLISALTRDGSQVRAFGEMVALLSADGNHQAALDLERMWNRLGKNHDFILFCAYPYRVFSGGRSEDLLHVCEEHGSVLVENRYFESFPLDGSDPGTFLAIR